jgi:hypothetical protein
MWQHESYPSKTQRWRRWPLGPRTCRGLGARPPREGGNKVTDPRSRIGTHGGTEPSQKFGDAARELAGGRRAVMDEQI